MEDYINSLMSIVQTLSLPREPDVDSVISSAKSSASNTCVMVNRQNAERINTEHYLYVPESLLDRTSRVHQLLAGVWSRRKSVCLLNDVNWKQSSI